MGNKGLGKKLLVYLMTFMMIFSSLPTSVFAAGENSEQDIDPRNAAQIGDHYNVSQTDGRIGTSTIDKDGYLKEDGNYVKDGEGKNIYVGTSEQDRENWRVRVNKTIKPTGNENRFDITLTVETKDDVKKHTTSADAGIVLVFDASSSMYNNNLGNVTRLDAAKVAAKQFITEYAKTESGNRYISIVYFYKNSVTHLGWTKVDKTDLPTIISTIDSIPGRASRLSGTNIEAGLLSAIDLLNSSTMPDVDYRNVVMLSDGAPYDYVSDTEESESTGDYNGTRYGYHHHYAHDGAVTASNTIRNTMGLDLHTVYCGDTETVPQNSSSDFPNCKYCKTETDTEDFLEDISDTVVMANDVTALAQAFADINEEINIKTQAWQGTDPMGSTGVLVDVKTKEGNTYVDTSSSLTWDLLKSRPTKYYEGKGEDKELIYKYSITYQVGLNTLLEDFNYNHYYETNAPTELEYYFEDKNGIEGTGTMQSIWFNIPTVKGYEGGYYKLIKKNENGDPLNNARFTITHTCDNCEICGMTPCNNCDDDDTNNTGDGTCAAYWDDESISGEAEDEEGNRLGDGYISFNNIPSGHSYVLEEADAPNGFAGTTDKYKLTVSYSEVSVYKMNEDGTVGDEVTGELAVINKELPVMDVSGKKIWIDNDNADGVRPNSITVNLFGTVEIDGTTYYVTNSEGAISGTEQRYGYKTVEASNNWEYVWQSVPKEIDDNPVTWYVTENAVPGYDTFYDGYDIVNIYTPETEGNTTVYNGQKKWIGGAASDLSLRLCIKDSDPEIVVATSEDGSFDWIDKEGDNWIFQFNGIKKFDDNGNAIQYEVKEGATSGYTQDSSIEYPKVEKGVSTDLKFVENSYKKKEFDVKNNQIGIVVAKESGTGNYQIWSSQSLSGKESEVIKFFSSNDKFHGLSGENTEFSSSDEKEYSTNQNGKEVSVTIEYSSKDSEVSIEFNDEDNKTKLWDSFYYGTISFTESYKPGTTILTNTKKTAEATVHDSVIVNKKDQDGKPLDGATFMLFAGDTKIKEFTGKSFKIKTDDESLAKYLPVPGETKEFILKETKAPAGYTKDTDTHRVVISASSKEVLTDNTFVTTTTYTITIDGKETTDIKNIYTLSPVEVPIKVTKVLDGRDWLDRDSFGFTLKNDTLEINDSLTLTKGKESGTFDRIEIDKPGEYTFKIKENIPSNAVNGKLNGITYDSDNERTVKVTVTDNGEGQLVANVTGDTYTEDKGEVFTNTYAPTPVQLPISGTKVMDGKTLNAGNFEFTITAAEGTPPMPANTTVKNGEGEDIDRFTFGSIEYTKAGEYTYTIKETKGSAPGVAYDNSEITAIVTVAEDQATGTLSANVVYKKGEETLNGLMFTNTYTVEPSDKVAFSASKKVTGHAYDLKAGKFSFTLSPSEDNGNNDPIKNDITVTNDEDGAVSFVSDAVYTEPGTYKYSVTEDHDNEIKGITYDNSTYLITVVVSENTQTAKLDTKITITKDGEPADAIVFSNNYEPYECTAVIKGKKSLSGKGMEAFTFQITQHQSTPNAPLPQDSEVQNDTAGVFEFNYGNITYTKAGTYVYEVTEKAVDKAGYTYDQSKYIVTVTVTDVNGELESAVKYEKNGEEKAEMTFANDYIPASVKVSIDGEKSLTGRDLNEGEFTFKLLDSDGNTAATAVNGEKGKFSFSDLTFTGTGTYTYTVVEDKSGAVLPGVTYSNEIYNVIIDVTDQNYDGQLDAAVKYYKNDSAVNGIEFTNTYEPAPAKLTLSGTKTFTGRDMKAGESFEFVISEDNNNAEDVLPNGMKVTVSDGKNGVPKSFTFGELTFTEPGTYRFDVNETKPANTNGIIYDTDTVNVTVKVDHDVNNGRLVVSEVKYNEGLFDKENGIAFENTFEPVSAVFEAEKVLTGRDLKAGEFTFQLVDANGNVIQEKTNNADGNIVFDAIEYDDTGNHTYTINEVQGDLGGVSYDNVPVKVTATVTVDDRTEKLVAVTAYEKNGSDNAVFNNSYTTGSIEVGLTGQKVLTGRDLEAGEFSFVLKDDDGNVLQTKENAAGGSITFDAIEYTEAGTYTYTISEIKGDLPGITYDEETVSVTVTVTDNGKGALKAEAKYKKGPNGEEKGTFAFENTYQTAPADPTTPDQPKDNEIDTESVK